MGACGTMTVTQAAVLLPEAEAPPACRREPPLRSEGSAPVKSVGSQAADASNYVANAAAGDVSAFEHLYRTHLPRVHSLVRRMSGGRDADELTQDVFVRVWQKLGSFRGDSAFATWLHRLAVNVVIERFRQETRGGSGCTTARRSSRRSRRRCARAISRWISRRHCSIAARRRARDLRAARRRGLQAPRDRARCSRFPRARRRRSSTARA